jgi:hypothetical protein
LASQPLARLKCAIARFVPRSVPDSMMVEQAAMTSSGAVSLLGAGLPRGRELRTRRTGRHEGRKQRERATFPLAAA